MNAAATIRGLVCHVNLASGYRGGERQTQLLIEYLAAAGCRQRLVARRSGDLAARCAGIPGLDIRATSSQPVLAARAARGADILHAHEARAIYACWLATRFSDSRYLLTRRVDNPFKTSFLRDIAYRAADRRVAVSSAIQAQIAARYGPSRCTVIGDAHADLARQQPGKPRLAGRFKGKTVVGHIGALDHSHKGQLTIIEAARLAQQAHPSLHFVLIGDGRDEGRMRAAAAGLRNVEFTGFVDNVGDWLAVFDVFVFPSLHEGLGSTLLDAMDFGLPVVATRVGGIPDIVEDGINGLLIDPEQPAALLDAVVRILADRELYERLAAGGRRQAARYSPRAMMERYLQLYRELSVEDRPASR